MLFLLGVIPFQGLRSGDCDCDCSGEAAEHRLAWGARQRAYANAVQAYVAIDGPITLRDPRSGETIEIEIGDDLTRREHHFAEEGDRAFVCYRLRGAANGAGQAERVEPGVCFRLVRKGGEEMVFVVDAPPILVGRKPSGAGGTEDMEGFVRFRCPKHWVVASHDPGSCHLCGDALTPSPAPSASPD